MEHKIALLGNTLDELKAIAAELGMPSYAAKQLADWIYKKKVHDIAAMTNIPQKFRTLLSERFEIGNVAPVEQLVSSDGTIKYLYQVGENRYVEAVYIPDKDRHTLCVSSQVGCKMNCKFCMTGRQGFTASLTAAEILNQIYSLPESDKLTNVVFMGMGEPLDNVDELLKVLDVLTGAYGYGWSPKRITVSTVGLLPGLKKILLQSDCHIAVSLHNPYSVERLEMMPVEKAYPLAKVLEELEKFDFSHQRRLSFEYIVFAGWNDTPRHIKGLKLLLKNLSCRINLIRFHAFPGFDLASPSMAEMEKMRDTLSGGNLICTIRASRGEDILAACGMLSKTRLDLKEKNE